MMESQLRTLLSSPHQVKQLLIEYDPIEHTTTWTTTSTDGSVVTVSGIISKTETTYITITTFLPPVQTEYTTTWTTTNSDGSVETDSGIASGSSIFSTFPHETTSSGPGFGSNIGPGSGFSTVIVFSSGSNTGAGSVSSGDASVLINGASTASATRVSSYTSASTLKGSGSVVKVSSVTNIIMCLVLFVFF